LLSIPVANYNVLHELRRVQGLVGFNNKEMIAVNERGIPGANGGVFLPAEVDEELALDVPLDEWTIQFVHDRLVELDKKNQLRATMMTLYEKFVTVQPRLPEQDEETAAKLRELRKGKKTVAIVGFAPESCSLAPYKDDVELWGMNEAHAYAWMKRATRWFQIHDSFGQPVAKRGIKTHHKWLKDNAWSIPIYMIREDPEIKKSVAYPLDEVCEKVFGKIRRGDDKIKYFCSSFDYQMGVAILEDFERIEVYGINMASNNEYKKQKPSAEFWLGIALGRGAEVYLPPNCQLMKSDIYGGREQGSGWSR
jgi:hypothetical protein